ncbi:MAG: peptidylprolyl isomerase [Gemmatimonadaceae bacterium]
MKRYLSAVVVAAASLAACDSFKEAMTAHVDVVAHAGSQELSVDRLADMLGKSKIPLNPDVGHTVADLWVNYQLLAEAAARGDSLNDPKAIDDAMWPYLAQMRVQKWHDVVQKSFPTADTSNAESKYNQGNMLAARHILLLVPQGATVAQKDSIHKKAEAIRALVVKNGDFAGVAQKESQDGSASKGGDLGLFARGAMVKEFGDATAALKPGEISPVVQTQFGYHIIRRATFDEVKNEFTRQLGAGNQQAAESTYLSGLEAKGEVKVRDGAVATVRALAKDPDAASKSGSVIATFKGGSFTAKRMAQWVSAFPNQPQIRQGLQQAPDSVVLGFVKNIVRNELVLKQADSAKVQLTPAELSDIRSKFTGVVVAAWQSLGIDPKMLKDSAKSPADRARLASIRVDHYLDALLENPQSVQFVDIPSPLQSVLRAKYSWKLNTAGVTRAIERAGKLRAKADSTRAMNRPPSAVPMGPPIQLQGQDSAAATKAPARPPATKKP